MIKNLQDELYQLEHKPAESIKLRAGMRWDLECGKCSKTFFKVLVMQNLQNQYLNYVLMIINENILAILSKGIVKSAKKTTSTTAATKFLGKCLNGKETSIEQLNLREARISLDEIIKSINSQRNNKSSGNNAPISDFYKHFSNELGSVL